MNEKKCVFFTDRLQWREWLSEHFEIENEIWFVFPSVDSGEKGVSYNDAVEEALCFGWIDGRAGTLDESHQLRRFTPRRKGSGYSQPNIERLIYLTWSKTIAITFAVEKAKSPFAAVSLTFTFTPLCPFAPP